MKGSRVLVDGETNPRLATLVQYLWMRVEQLNETLAAEWHRMVDSEQQRMGREGEEEDEEEEEMVEERTGSSSSNGSNGSGSNGSNGSGGSSSSSDGSSGAAREQQLQEAEAVASGFGGGGVATAAAQAVYSPGAPSSGTATGGPGSIPQAAEQHVQEVSSTGAAISLALLLQQRSEQAEAGGDQLPWVSPTDDKQQAHSTAALSALAYLEPCAHGLDELIVFDALRRKFGIAPQVEGRIRRTGEQLQQEAQPAGSSSGSSSGSS